MITFQVEPSIEKTLDIVPSKILRTPAPTLVRISMPLFSTITFSATGCGWRPKLSDIKPFSTGHGRRPLLFSRLLDNASASGVRDKLYVGVGLGLGGILLVIGALVVVFAGLLLPAGDGVPDGIGLLPLLVVTDILLPLLALAAAV